MPKLQAARSVAVDDIFVDGGFVTHNGSTLNGRPGARPRYKRTGTVPPGRSIPAAGYSAAVSPSDWT